MLLKATQAVFDDNALSKAPRYPTDLWSGYGFSSSLPADLLKGILDISDDDVELPKGRPILGRDAKTVGFATLVVIPPRGLCAVREEDELSEFSGSFSSSSVNSSNRVFETKTRSAFSASTSIFDSSPLVSEFTWDIRVFVDPAMVLAQLGCSEYMTQLREQEVTKAGIGMLGAEEETYKVFNVKIDMHAFLLLDEHNLKDIGVSTIGARKKIHHAIIRISTVFELFLYNTFQRKPIGRERVWPILDVITPPVSRAEYTLEEDSVVVQLDTRWAVEGSEDEQWSYIVRINVRLRMI
ncbi:unnamed protein product [Angiostrongylus costaricensis]|uniref:SAM domain-containing protein n=1 Tax=Angiostrongylus costaricensis TaxID=334426 RepID=A0A158PH59_ANGCS|nr:unnamed protein product [Angiostrongylus costaricensis]